MTGFALTRVRHTEEDSRAILDTFLFEGRYAPSRTPRGIAPELVGRVLIERLAADSPPEAYGAAVQLMLFYERSEVVPHLKLALTRSEATGTDLLRSAYVLQAAADLGSAQEASAAAVYFDRYLAPHPALTTRLYALFFDTLLAIAPHGSPAKLLQRLAAETQRLSFAQHQSAARMFEYDAMRAVQRNDARSAQIEIANKSRLAREPVSTRRPELVRVYAGLDPAGKNLTIWAARMLRREVMEGNAAPVLAELGTLLDRLDPKLQGPALFRAAEAISYLGGTLTAKQLSSQQHIQVRTENFLSDV